MYQNMRRSRFHACRTQVGLLKNLHCRSILNFRDRQFCHCGNVEPPTEFMVGWDMCGTACPPTPMSPPPDLGIVEACGTSLHTMVSFIWMNFSSTCTPQIYSTSFSNYAFWDCETKSGPEPEKSCIFPFTELGG